MINIYRIKHFQYFDQFSIILIDITEIIRLSVVKTEQNNFINVIRYYVICVILIVDKSNIWLHVKFYENMFVVHKMLYLIRTISISLVEKDVQTNLQGWKRANSSGHWYCYLTIKEGTKRKMSKLIG